MISLLKVVQSIDEVNDDKIIKDNDESIAIKKKKIVKELKKPDKHRLKQIYDRTFRSLK